MRHTGALLLSLPPCATPHRLSGRDPPPHPAVMAMGRIGLGRSGWRDMEWSAMEKMSASADRSKSSRGRSNSSVTNAETLLSAVGLRLRASGKRGGIIKR